jgi:hypothetical protein
MPKCEKCGIEEDLVNGFCYICKPKAHKERTKLQNRALHLYFTLLADELNGSGADMKVVLKPEIQIPWDGKSIKEFIWRPVQKAALGKESTTELRTNELQTVWEIINRHIGEAHGVHVPFPSEDQTKEYLNSLKDELPH